MTSNNPTPSLTDEKVAAIRARLEAADWGPWKVYVEVLEKNQAGLREFPEETPSPAPLIIIDEATEIDEAALLKAMTRSPAQDTP